MRNVSLFVIPLLLLTAFSGCQRDANSTKEKFIEDMLVAFGNQKKDLLKQAKGVFEAIRVYRDGKNDIVVFERKLSEGKTLEDPGLKSHLIQEIKESRGVFKNEHP